MGVTNNKKFSKLLLTLVNTLEFFMVFGKHGAKETRKVEYATIGLFLERWKL